MKALVVGLAKSGVAAAELLVKLGADVTVCDVKPEAAAAVAHLPVRFAVQSDDLFIEPRWIILSPGVPADLPALDRARAEGKRVVGEVELAAPFLRGRTIGITGSNGKTTVTAMVGHLLRECGVACQVGGNIGTPVCAMTETSDDAQFNVLELSSFQLETIITFHAHVGACLNVTPDHLDRHHTFAAYAAAKGKLFANQVEGDVAVLNAEDETCREYARTVLGRVVWFGNAGEYHYEHGTLWHRGTRLIESAELRVRGRHNVENAMAAIACAEAAGAGVEAAALAATTFEAVEHRLEFVRTVNGVDYFNDSKATNVDAALKALDAFSGKLWVILGGKDKGSAYAPLASPLREKARGALLIGAASAKIAAALDGAVELIDAGTIDRAVSEASRRAEPGDTVLLAPACASFDQFTSYEHRGRTFKELVGKL